MISQFGDTAPAPSAPSSLIRQATSRRLFISARSMSLRISSDTEARDMPQPMGSLRNALGKTPICCS